MPDRFVDFKIKLYINELSIEVINASLKREIKFSELFLYQISTEYTNNMDSFMKSTKNLIIYKSSFRQIFPKPMTNDTENCIESL